MSAASLAALIVAITGLLGAIPAIILAVRGKGQAAQAHAIAARAQQAIDAHGASASAHQREKM